MRLSGTDIRLLRVFMAVIRHKGFAAAQAELNVGQSTISGQIAALEQRLGVKLCHRGRAGFHLTPQGESVHQSLERLLLALDQFATETSALRGTLAGLLRLGVVDGVASDPAFRLPDAIAAIMQRAPAVRIQISQGSPQDLQSALFDEKIDILVGSFPHKINGLEYKRLYEEENFLYCGRAHGLHAVAEKELSPEAILLMPTAGRLYWREDHANNRHFQKTTAYASGIEQQLILILSGAYVGYLPNHFARPYCEDGRLRCLLPSQFRYTCPFDAVTRRDATLPPAASALLDELLRLTPSETLAF